jgi:hypothetical protein
MKVTATLADGTTVEAMDTDHAAWLIRKSEDEARARAKAEADARPITVEVSEDPTTGLQPAINSHDAWEAEARQSQIAPRCTGCGAALDPTYCDPEARARAAEYDAAQKAAVTEAR